MERCDKCDEPMLDNQIHAWEVDEHEEPFVLCESCYLEAVAQVNANSTG